MKKVITKEIEEKIRKKMKLFDDERSALLPALYLVQESVGYIPDKAIEELSQIFGISKAEISGVVSFYKIFRRKPLGKYNIEVCRNIVCYLNGGKEIVEFLKKEYGIEPGGVSKDGKISLSLVECIGQCENAPAIKIGEEFYGPVDPESIKNIIEGLK